MSRLTVRLPDSLHQLLDQEAEREGVSLNHYIVYSLTRAVTAADLQAQKSAFERLTSRVPAAEAETALQEVLSARTQEPAR
jgi:HicB-like protein involved in pilus formation